MAGTDRRAMEKIRVSKVDDVTLYRQGKKVEGVLHLTAHHLIFSYIVPPPAEQAESESQQKPKSRELWITYPMINFCTYRPAPPASRQAPSIRVRCRDFTFVAFHFGSEGKARDVYDSIRSLTCRLGRLEKLYAFSYIPQSPENKVNGWEIYDAEKEWRRLGIGGKNPDYGWRISRINVDYEYSPTYPALLVVPSVISDNVLNYAGKYRSRARIPALTYRHPVNNCSITRSSQPFAGFQRNRSIQDEKLVAAIFATSLPSQSQSPPQSQSPTSTPLHTSSPEGSTENIAASQGSDASEINAEKIEDEELAQAQKGPKIYGAQQRNLIVDARPTVNAIAMQAVGRGSENMDYYKGAAKAYLGIDNIHVMRRSLDKVVAALKETDVTPLGPNRELLAKSGWLQHIANLLDGSALIARQVGIQHSHVLIHCSDGWDRTSQLSALSQLCLDPYYRTIEGFCVLVEKDWLSFGHMFRYRAGLLGHEKWFEVENERIGGDRNGANGAGGTSALENAFLSAKGLFNRKNESRESLTDSDTELQTTDAQQSNPRRSGSGPRSSVDEKRQTKVNEVSPIFHQFLDATYQLLYQHPTRFEFNERFLRRLLYHQYSCQYGTFLYDNEKERVEAKVKERTRSVWDYFLCRREQFTNPRYDPVVDDNVRGKERLLFPRINEVRWWAELFGRQDEEMNGPTGPIGAPPSFGDASPLRNGARTPILAGLETNEQATGVAANVVNMPSASLPLSHNTHGQAQPPTQGQTQTSLKPNPFEQGAAALSTGLANLVGKGTPSSGPSPSRSRDRSPRPVGEETGVEML